MGSLAHFNLGTLRKRQKLAAFVETGTGDGAGVMQAVMAGFPVIHSIEIMVELVAAARKKFAAHPGVRIHQGDSRVALPAILGALPRQPTLFWLDAHFPGADYGLGSYEGEANLGRRLPLAEEVALIAKERAGLADVVLIDDARIYQPGPYGAGNLPEDWPPLRGVRRSLDFVREAFAATHGVVVDYAGQGYVMVTPRWNQ